MERNLYIYYFISDDEPYKTEHQYGMATLKERRNIASNFINGHHQKEQLTKAGEEEQDDEKQKRRRKKYPVSNNRTILSAFATLRKATISVVMSVSPSVRPSVRMEQLASYWTDFYEICYKSFLICRENLRFINI